MSTSRPLRVAFVGDDFTGASDTLATLARSGRTARLYLSCPKPETLGPDEVVGVATPLRALEGSEAERLLEELAPRLVALAPQVLHYKVCSTFDSAPDVGSIGLAARVLARHLRPVAIAVVGGQPSLGRHCVFGSLFARAADGAVHRIDRHPVMSVHPVTPMGEADLRIHLAAQGLGGQGLEEMTLVDGLALRDGPQPLLDRLGPLTRRTDPPAILFDAYDTEDPRRIGGILRALAVAGPILVIGASSVAEALAPSWPLPPVSPLSGVPAVEGGAPPPGPAFVFAGSRSQVTAGQVAAATAYREAPLDPIHLSDDLAMEELVTLCVDDLKDGRNVLAHLRADADYGMGSGALAHRTAAFVAAVTTRAQPRRLGIAGGDTSSMVVQYMEAESLEYLGDMDRGVPLCRVRVPGSPLDGLALFLKGGQMGAADLFDRFAHP